MNGTKSSVERRKWERLPLPIPVFVHTRDGNSKGLLEFTTALNVSAGGMLLAARNISPASSEIRLEIPGGSSLPALEMLPKTSRDIHARVLRSTPADGYNLLGLKFSHPLLRRSKRYKSKKRKIISVG
jgi:hypothetical protein